MALIIGEVGNINRYIHIIERFVSEIKITIGYL